MKTGSAAAWQQLMTEAPPVERQAVAPCDDCLSPSQRPDMETPATKTCAMCAMEIPAKARRCPHCAYFQTRSARVWHHPVMPALLIVAAFIALSFLAESIMPFRREYPPYSGQIEIVGSRLVFGQGWRGPTAGVVGELRNTSPVSWKDVRFHVEFRDAEGKPVDADQTQQVVGDYDVPSGATLAFEVSFERKYPQEKYATHSVRIVSAKDARWLW
jgi:hypothetical protein